MKAYGGTCPLCCGDLDLPRSIAGKAVCSFCGITLENHEAGHAPRVLELPAVNRLEVSSAGPGGSIVVAIVPFRAAAGEPSAV